MTNSLPPDLATFVQSVVATGKFATPDEVVVAGLRLLQERDEYNEYVRRELQKGLDELKRGEYIEISNDEEIDAFFEQQLKNFMDRADADRKLRETAQ